MIKTIIAQLAIGVFTLFPLAEGKNATVPELP
jgi:hypothetical protein